MRKPYLWTALKSRLQFIKCHGDKSYHWLFLPGGPGLGSESLSGLTQILHLPGTIWHLDLPGDGSNVTGNDSQHFSHWSEALVEAVESLDRVILVAHSTGGMYVLATPPLEGLLAGLVLLDSAPDSSWQESFREYVRQHPLTEVASLNNLYVEEAGNALLKKRTITSAPYLFTKVGVAKGISLLETLPINHETCDWSALHFDSTYSAKWVPKNIPTLILAGSEDHVTPLQLFSRAKKFQRDNIVMRLIERAGHFPWIENPDQIVSVFEEYCQRLRVQT